MQKTDVTPLHPDVRVTNRAGVAAFFGVNVVTIDAWIRRGMPYLDRGERGKQWKFDLLECAKWKFNGPTEADVDPELLPPKDRLDYYRGSRERDRYLEEAGQLIPAALHEQQLATVFKEIALSLESLADVLERDTNIGPTAVERVQAATDRYRESLYDRIANLTIVKPDESGAA